MVQHQVGHKAAAHGLVCARVFEWFFGLKAKEGSSSKEATFQTAKEIKQTLVAKSSVQ